MDRGIMCGALAAALLCCAAAWAQAQTRLPAGMSFIAQENSGQWGLYRAADDGKTVRVPTQLEPRHACIAPRASKGIYSAADGSLRLLSLDGATEKPLVLSDQRRSYTQPCISADGNVVYAVEMAEGKSLETEIVRWEAKENQPMARIARQPGAQLEPFIHANRWLTYANVACSEGCDRLLVEIWLRDLVTGQARQLTLLNALSQGPVTDGKQVVFSSDADAGFQLWRVNTDGTELRRLTDGAAQALQPAICDGAVYYVRSQPGGSALMRLSAGGKTVEIPLPGLRSIRALRCVS